MSLSSVASSGNACVVIPAFRPGNALLSLVAELEKFSFTLVVVDDGSGAAYRHIFDQLEGRPAISVIRHAVNLGKGAALRTGMNYAFVTYPDCKGVVTADADGQHHPDDIRRVADSLAAQPDHLVLGVREFREDVPLRSRFGNQVTRMLFRMIHGTAVSDTQTGLRGIPRYLGDKLLTLETRGYEFELDMLITARYMGVPLLQVPIRTIYLDENVSSHFHPLLDSMRIYFLLMRFAAASATTALVDNLIFYLAFAARKDVLLAQVLARSVAIFVNFRLNRQLVFHADASSAVWLKYIGVVIVSGGLSYSALTFLVSVFQWHVMTAKIMAETTLFLFNFAFLRDFVFTRSSSAPKATDWSKYYQSVPPTDRLTRKYTTRTILDSLASQSFTPDQSRVLEFGGANSCFLDAIVRRFHPAEYHVADTNQYGLDLLRNREVPACHIQLHNADILRTRLPGQFDLVYSIGLIEHFDPSGTAEAIRSHFRHTRPGGLVLISFPRPTLLYRIARGFLEVTGLWKFPDERALQPREVLQSIQGNGTVLFQKTLWPLILTQHLIVVRTNLS